MGEEELSLFGDDEEDAPQDVLSLFPEIKQKMAENEKTPVNEPTADEPMALIPNKSDDTSDELDTTFKPAGTKIVKQNTQRYPSLPENSYIDSLSNPGNRDLDVYAHETLSGINDSYVSVGDQRGFVETSRREIQKNQSKNLDYLEGHYRYWQHLAPSFFPWGPVYPTELPASKALAPQGPEES